MISDETREKVREAYHKSLADKEDLDAVSEEVHTPQIENSEDDKESLNDRDVSFE
jgi:hypothetical protein